MTIFGLLSLLLLAPTGTQDDLRRQVERLSDEIDRFRKREAEAQQRRDNAIKAYESALQAYRTAKADYGRAALPKPPAALASLREATEKFVEAAFAAYAAVPKKRQEIRGWLAVTVEHDQKSKLLIEALESGVLAGQETPEAISELLYQAGDKLELARMLALPENADALRSLLQDLHDTYHVAVDPKDAPKYDFRNVFETLRSLNAEAYEQSAGKAAASMGILDPEIRLVHQRLRVVYLLEKDAASPVLDGFKDAFSGWMRMASPDRAIKELSYQDWRGEDVRELMTAAERILSKESPAAALPACPTNSSSVAFQRQQILCAPEYGGIIAVESAPVRMPPPRPLRPGVPGRKASS